MSSKFSTWYACGLSDLRLSLFDIKLEYRFFYWGLVLCFVGKIRYTPKEVVFRLDFCWALSCWNFTGICTCNNNKEVMNCQCNDYKSPEDGSRTCFETSCIRHLSQRLDSAHCCVIVLLSSEIQFCVRFFLISKHQVSCVAVTYRSIRMQ
jgi:hypothetical protein